MFRRLIWFGFAVNVLVFCVGVLGAGVGEADVRFLEERLGAALDGMLALVEIQTGLPVDIGVGGPEGMLFKDTKTSPTNIGLLIASLVVARDSGHLPGEEVEPAVAAIIDQLERMEKHEGFFYNWYDLSTIEDTGAPAVGAASVDPTAQRFVSSVDNANLAVALMVAVGAFPETELARRASELLAHQDWSFFYRMVEVAPGQFVPRMNHGFYVDRGTTSTFDYGTFMTEARLLAFIALLLGDVPPFPCAATSPGGLGYMEALAKICGLETGERIVVIPSWGGSLFEELFPDLFVDEMQHSDSLAENHRRVVAAHIASQNPETGLWGWSPSQGVDCQYREAGVACVGSGGHYPLGDVSPYSIALAARYVPEVAIATLRSMEQLNSQAYAPRFGYADSISQDGQNVCADYLSLDKGMEVLGVYATLQHLRGAQGVSNYFWLFMDAIGRGAQGRTMLSELRFDDCFYGAAAQRTGCAPGQPELDVLAEFSSWGIGGGEGGCMNGVCNGFAWTGVPPDRLSYSVQGPGAFAYYAMLSLDDRSEKQPVNIAHYSALVVRYRGGVDHPARFRVELKAHGSLLESFVVEGVTGVEARGHSSARRRVLQLGGRDRCRCGLLPRHSIWYG